MDRKRFFSRLAPASLALTLAVGAPAAADVDVTALDDARWRVSAEGESLDQVVTRLAEESGLRLTGADRLAAGPGFEGEIEGDIDEVVLRLLRGRDYALVYGETPETAETLQRIVILSNRVGDIAPDSAARPAAERIEPARPVTQEEAERVTALLRRQVQPLLDAEAEDRGEGVVVAAATGASAPTGGDTGGDSGGDLDADTQAQLAEATRRARADLEALVNALRAQDAAANNGN